MITPIAFTLPSGAELLVILMIILILFGAKRLPELARGLGSSIKEFKKAKQEFDDELTKAGDDLKIEEPKEKQPHQTHNS